ncbi:MAG: translation initiation factor IF-3 [Sedimentisphaerales bacterium]|nr:translation initiation factor IF-3 [Sedimentisphaerales bacterium]
MRLNEQIRVPQVRVIDQNNDQRGVIPTLEALNMAREAGIDLVEVAPNSDPPVCRLMDYGKWKYDQKKKEHKARVKQHNVTLKEVRLRPKTDEHDRSFKVKRARLFLAKGDKVQFTMLFRGRELAHLDLAEKMLLGIVEDLADVSKLEVPPRKMGRRMTMMLAPDKVTVKQ